MKNFNQFNKDFIRNTIIAGSILLSAEQGLAQTEPKKTEKYIPDKNWSFDTENGKLEATKKSLLYPGYLEDYLLDEDSTYIFNGYITADGGGSIRPLKEVEGDIAKLQNKIAYQSDPQKMKEKFDYQFTQKYKEEYYKNKLENQKEQVGEAKKAIERYKVLLKIKNRDDKYYKSMNDCLREEEEKYQGLSSFLNSLLNKENSLKDPKVISIYTYEEIVSQFEISKKQSEVDLKKLLIEKEKTEKYFTKFKENK